MVERLFEEIMAENVWIWGKHGFTYPRSSVMGSVINLKRETHQDTLQSNFWKSKPKRVSWRKKRKGTHHIQGIFSKIISRFSSSNFGGQKAVSQNYLKFWKKENKTSSSKNSLTGKNVLQKWGRN